LPGWLADRQVPAERAVAGAARCATTTPGKQAQSAWPWAPGGVSTGRSQPRRRVLGRPRNAAPPARSHRLRDRRQAAYSRIGVHGASESTPDAV